MATVGDQPTGPITSLAVADLNRGDTRQDLFDHDTAADPFDVSNHLGAVLACFDDRHAARAPIVTDENSVPFAYICTS